MDGVRRWSLCAAVRRFEGMEFDAGVIRRNAERFSVEAFRRVVREEMERG